jgi:HK97 gp10 family phage protein
VAVTPTIRVRGLDAVNRRIASWPPKIQNKVLRKALRLAGNKQKKRLKAGTPRQTGFSARQVRLKVQVSSKRATAKLGYKGRASAWMRMRDSGTVRQPARPYFDRALAGWEGQVERDFSEALRQVVEGVA